MPAVGLQPDLIKALISKRSISWLSPDALSLAVPTGSGVLPFVPVFHCLFCSQVLIFLAYPTGISVNPIGARKCRLT